MPDQDDPMGYTLAVNDFHRAHNQAQLQELLSRLTGSYQRLLQFDEVRQLMQLSGGVERGLRDIPLDAIVGSVGRYSDFTRNFLPLKASDRERWARVKVAASGLVGLPPIEVYQIGNVYFVKDGNHRVSVARQFGAAYIQAYVTEVQTHVPLNPDVQPDDLIRIAEYNRFLEQTRLDMLRPEADLSVSVPGQYPILLNHIEVHRYYLGLDLERDISSEEAIMSWYDTVYLPVVEVIRRLGIMHRFPGRTETDLYLWITEHRKQLENELGTHVRTEYAAGSLAERSGPGYDHLLARLGNRLMDILVPEKLEGGPAAGIWRSQALSGADNSRLFIDLLVPINGQEDGWCALEQAIVVAQREAAKLFGLHVNSAWDETSAEAQALRSEFEERCRRAGLAGSLIVSGGEIVEQTCLRAAVTDLVVVNLSHPPAARPLERLNSGFRDLIQRCPRPVLATPQTVSTLNSAVVAYDGSRKADEALFIAAYLAGKWKIPLTVLTVDDSAQNGETTQLKARQYLERREVQADYRIGSGFVGAAILQAAGDCGADWIIMGGYGLSPVFELALGSVVNDLLRTTTVPVLICR